MRLTILGGGASWPSPRSACGGYLVEHQGYTLLVDPGFAVLPQLLALQPITQLDAVLVSHSHLDHCADLPAVLTARAAAGATAPLPVLAPRRSVEDVLRAGHSHSLARSAEVIALRDGDVHDLGPFRLEAALLPHQVTNAGFRLTAGSSVLAYTGDSGDCAEREALARGATVLLAEATFAEEVPEAERRFLSSSAQVARLSLAAEVEHTILTHHLPNEPLEPWLSAARAEGLESVLAASAGMSVDLERDEDSEARRSSGEVEEVSRIPVLPRRALSLGAVLLGGRRAVRREREGPSSIAP